MIHDDPKGLAISVEIEGPAQIAKASFPLRYGRYSEIKTADYEFRFNLNGEIKFIRGLGVHWPHPAEQLKRTDGNDWVYYSVGDKSSEYGVVSWLGEYYLPCLPYPSNAVWQIDYQSNPNIMGAFAAWSQLYADLQGACAKRLHPKAEALAARVFSCGDSFLFERAQMLRRITGGRISVLPPDTRHVDYEIIPLMIADGCRHHCSFCCVKTLQPFRVRPQSDIDEQIRRLVSFYGRNLENYWALFLGNHDALAAGEEAIRRSAEEAARAFGFSGASANAPSLFFFGSVDALLRSRHALFEKLDRLPFKTYINIGFESVDPATLQAIGKPVSEAMVREAFRKMAAINNDYNGVEITGNFLIGGTLSRRHYASLTELLADAEALPRGKGTAYLSPIKDSAKKRELLPQFFAIQNQSKLPVYIYLIQRL